MTRAERIEKAARALVAAIERAECAQSQPAYRNAREDWGEAEDALRAALSTQEETATEVRLVERSEDGRRGYLQGYAAGVEAAAKRVERDRVVCNGPLPESTEVLVGGIQACLASIAREIRILAPQEPPAADHGEGECNRCNGTGKLWVAQTPCQFCKCTGREG